MRIKSILIIVSSFVLISSLMGGEADAQPRVYIKATGAYWAYATLAGVANVYGVPVAIESSDYDEWYRSRREGVTNPEGIIASLPFVSTDPGAAIRQVLEEIKSVIKNDAFTVNILTDQVQHFGPPNKIFSGSVPPSILEFAGEMLGLERVARAMANEGEPDSVFSLDHVQVKVPDLDPGKSLTYLDLLQIWSQDFRRERNRNISWYLMPMYPARLIEGGRQDVRFGLLGFQGGIGGIIDPNIGGSRWVCRVSGLHPMLGALELSQVMNESRVDFYVYSVPEAVNKNQPGARPRAPGAVFGPHGGGKVTSLVAWRVFASGIATGDSLSAIVASTRFGGPRAERIKHTAGNEVRINQVPNFFDVAYVANAGAVEENVEAFLVSTLRRHWPDITLEIGPCGVITDEHRRVPDMFTAKTVRDVLVQLVPEGVTGTWAMIEDLNGSYTLSFQPTGKMVDLSVKEDQEHQDRL